VAPLSPMRKRLTEWLTRPVEKDLGDSNRAQPLFPVRPTSYDRMVPLQELAAAGLRPRPNDAFAGRSTDCGRGQQLASREVT
jgi:hypothetical protein